MTGDIMQNKLHFYKTILLTGLLSAFSLSMQAVNAQELRLDPAKVKGPDACGECHEDSVASWKLTHHAKSFKTMSRSDDAKKITKKMGIKRVKADSDCLTCHFTSADKDGKTKPIAGITCESCHGAGADWIDVHSDYGGKDVKAENEDPAHKVKRFEESEAAGMLRPSDLYRVAENCYSCHTVPNEKLVNVGGHEAGSTFELVAWSQGEMRHNIWYSKDNEEASLERRRVMFVMGKMLDLEFAYRGLAKATQKAAYAVKMAKRAKLAQIDLTKISKATKLSQVDAILKIASGIKLKLNNEAGYLKAADAVSKQAKQLSANDGSNMGGIDALLPKADKYKGDPWAG